MNIIYKYIIIHGQLIMYRPKFSIVSKNDTFFWGGGELSYTPPLCSPCLVNSASWLLIQTWILRQSLHKYKRNLWLGVGVDLSCMAFYPISEDFLSLSFVRAPNSLN